MGLGSKEVPIGGCWMTPGEGILMGKVIGLRQQPPLDQALWWHCTSFVQDILHLLSEEEAAVPILQINN